MGSKSSVPEYYPGQWYPPQAPTQYAPHAQAVQPGNYSPLSKVLPNQPMGQGATVVDIPNNTLWVPDELAATVFDLEDGKANRKWHGMKVKVMKQKNGLSVFPGNPAEYGYPEHENPKDPYRLAGVAPGGTVYDARTDTILCPDALTATQLDLSDGVKDGTYHGTKLKVKKSLIPAYNAELAAKRYEGPYAEARYAQKYGMTVPSPHPQHAPHGGYYNY